MVKGFRSLLDREQNLDPTHALTMRLSLQRTRYPKPSDVAAFTNGCRVCSRCQVSSRPALANAIPHSMRALDPWIREGGMPPAPGEQRIAVIASVSPEYFRATDIPIVAGRAPGAHDMDSAWISQGMAERYWPAEEPDRQTYKVSAGAVAHDRRRGRRRRV